MKKLVLATAVLALGAVVAQAQTALTTDGDISVAGNWDSGLPTLASPGTIGSGMTANRDADVDITGHIIVGNGGALIDTGDNNYAQKELSGGGILTIQTGGSFVRTNAVNNNTLRILTGATLNVNGGDVYMAGLVGMSGVGGATVNVTDGTLVAVKSMNFNKGSEIVSINVSGGTAEFGVVANDQRAVDDGNTFWNVSGGTLTLNDLTYTALANDTNIVVTISGDGELVTHQFNRKNNIAAQADRYVNLLGEDGASWTWTGTNEAAFVTLWDAGTLKHDGANTGTFAENFSVTGDTLTVIPEPATLGLIAAFGGGILFIRRKLMM